LKETLSEIVEITWINVADTAVKIGLGALISAVSGYVVIKVNLVHEERKEKRRDYYKQQEEKKIKYVEFLSQSQSLVQSYLSTSCTADTDEYKGCLRAFNEVQIISSDEVRLAAYDLLSAVDQFVVIRKNDQEVDILKNMRRSVDEKTGLFQKLVQLEVTKPYGKK